MKYVRQVATVAMKDVRAELRTKEAINASLAFALMILLLFSYTFDPEQEMMRQVSGGLLWIVFAFGRHAHFEPAVFARELPNDCLGRPDRRAHSRLRRYSSASASPVSCWSWPSNSSRCQYSASSIGALDAPVPALFGVLLLEPGRSPSSARFSVRSQ